MMKLGIGLYRHMLNKDYYKFARQCGCTHLIIHLADYYKNQIVTETNENKNYGVSNEKDDIWRLESILKIKKEAKEYGLEIYGIENFAPADWYDVLLDGKKRDEQMEYLKEIIKTVGKAGIKSFGYNFSLAGVWGHTKKAVARGGAISNCFNAKELNLDVPIKNGEVWNMTYDECAKEGYIEEISYAVIWDRLKRFLDELLPVAEEFGVELALHPDDPPMPMLRKTPRLVYKQELYQKLIDLNKSKANKLEFCMGSIAEMQGSNIYEAIEQYASQDKISYVHFRNVKGKVPCYNEVFVDEGDIDMLKALKILKKHDFEGVLIPDHTPEILCDAPWHAGMAYALGYMKALFKVLEEEDNAKD